MIRKGSVVRLKKETAVVITRLSDIKGGVLLDRHLDDFRYWNVADLINVRSKLASAPTSPW